MKIYHTLDGVKDIYGENFYIKQRLQQKLHGIFCENGYRDIATPTLEYFDVFSKGLGTRPSKDLYKFYDKEGETCVLRPDFTPSIARCVARYFGNEDRVRLTYMGNTYVETSNYQGKLKETTQMGIEFMGEQGLIGDIEAVKLAIFSLKEAGLENFIISVGHADYFYSLCRQYNISDEVMYTLKDFISVKNFVKAKEYLIETGAEDEAVTAFMNMEDCTGKKVLDMAAWDSENEGINSIIDRLTELYKNLCRENLEKYVTFDLSLLPKYQYYTGIVFNAYAYGVGDAVLKGGRYDRLMQQFGMDKPAIGFCVMIDDLCQAIGNNNKEDYLTFALTKGRLAGDTMKLLDKIGITCREMQEDSRKLVFTNHDLKLRFFLSKGPDVPTYVESGAADIGVVGADTILEEQRNVLEVLDLGFGKCNMCVCGQPDKKKLLLSGEKIRVATKYPVMARDYFYNVKNQTVEFIKLNGSVELGPIVGLSDVIVDIVETGKTLRENGLEVLEKIQPLSARMIINPVSMQLNNERIREIIKQIKEVL